MKRRITGIVAAVVLALFGTLILVGYVQSAKDKATASERLYPVLVVTKTITKGTASSAITDSVKTEQVPAKVKASSAVADIGALKGLVAGADLVPGEEVLSSRFITPQAAAQGNAPPDKLRVTISLDPQRVVGGQLHAGDTVAVVMSFQGANNEPDQTHLVLHQVLVTDVQGGQSSQTKGSGTATAQTAPNGTILVTLAVDAPSVERVVYAAEFGKVWLAAEPATAPQDGTKIVTRGNVYQ
jgi:pilus assembly protein CpaB